MRDVAIRFPDRPVQVRPPGKGLGSQLGLLLAGLLVIAGAVLIAAHPIKDLLLDRDLGAVETLPDGRLDGRCTTHLVLVNCDATLTATVGGREVVRKVHYFFVDLHVGNYATDIVVDPAHPDLITTRLALDKLTNRTITLLVAGPLFLLLAIAVAIFFKRGLGRDRALVRALSTQPLRAVVLHLDVYAMRRWVVSTGRQASEWRVPARARPIVVDPSQRGILAVTAGDGAFAMPLDAELRWLALTADERQAVWAAVGSDALGPALRSLETPADLRQRTRLRRVGGGIAIAGAVMLAGAGAVYAGAASVSPFASVAIGIAGLAFVAWGVAVRISARRFEAMFRARR